MIIFEKHIEEILIKLLKCKCKKTLKNSCESCGEPQTDLTVNRLHWTYFVQTKLSLWKLLFVFCSSVSPTAFITTAPFQRDSDFCFSFMPPTHTKTPFSYQGNIMDASVCMQITGGLMGHVSLLLQNCLFNRIYVLVISVLIAYFFCFDIVENIMQCYLIYNMVTLCWKYKVKSRHFENHCCRSSTVSAALHQ